MFVSLYICMFVSYLLPDSDRYEEKIILGSIIHIFGLFRGLLGPSLRSHGPIIGDQWPSFQNIFRNINENFERLDI